MLRVESSRWSRRVRKWPQFGSVLQFPVLKGKKIRSEPRSLSLPRRALGAGPGRSGSVTILQAERSLVQNTSMDSTPVMPQLSRSSSTDETKLSLPRPLKKFYLGEPLALGITQILTAVVGIAFGVVMEMSHKHIIYYLVLKTPYWTGVLYLISGSLSVAASRNPKMALVKGMLGMNIMSALAAGIGIIVLCFSLNHLSPRWNLSYICDHHKSEAAEKECIAAEVMPYYTLYGMLALFLAFTILEFCIAISSAAFGCKTVCRDACVETVVVVYQNVTPINADSQTAASMDPEIP